MDNLMEQNGFYELDKFDASNLEQTSEELFKDENINNLLKEFVEEAKAQLDLDPVTLEKINQMDFKLQVGLIGAYANFINGAVTIKAYLKDDTSSGANTVEHGSIKSIMDKFISQPSSFIILANTIYKAIDAALNGENDDIGRLAVGLIKDGLCCVFNIGKFVDGILTAKYDMNINGATWFERLKTYYTTVDDIVAYYPHYAYDLEKNTLTRYATKIEGATEIPTDDIIVSKLSPLENPEIDLPKQLKSIVNGNPNSEVAGLDGNVELTSYKPIDPDGPNVPDTGNLKPIVDGNPSSEVAGIDDDIILLGYNPIGTGGDSVSLPSSTYMTNIKPVLKSILTYGSLGLDFMGLGISIYDFIKADEKDDIKPQHVMGIGLSLSGLSSSLLSLARGASMAGNVMGFVTAAASLLYNLTNLDPDNPYAPVDAVTNSFGLGSIASSAAAAAEYNKAADNATNSIDRRIYEALADIKTLDAIPVVNWFSAIYTSIDKDDIRDEILDEYSDIEYDSDEQKRIALSMAVRDMILENYKNPLESFSQKLLNDNNVDVVQVVTLAKTDNGALSEIFEDKELPPGRLYNVTYEIKDGGDDTQPQQLADTKYVLDQQNNRTVIAEGFGSSIDLSVFGLDYVNNRILVVDYGKEELSDLAGRETNIDLNIKAVDYYKGIDSKIYAPLNDVMRTKVEFGSGNDILSFDEIIRVRVDNRSVIGIADGGDGVDIVSLKDIGGADNKVYEAKYSGDFHTLKFTGDVDITLSNFENIILPGYNATNRISLEQSNSQYSYPGVISLQGEDAKRNEVNFKGLKGTRLRFIGTTNENVVDATESNDELYSTLKQEDSISYGTSTLHGWGGDDLLVGSKGVDFLYGDDGNDVIYGNGGADTVEGGKGDDTIYYDKAMIKIDGGEGKDILNLTEFDKALNLTSTLKDAIGFDAIGFEGVVGTRFNDVINAFADSDSNLAGEDGNDSINDNDHNGYLLGGNGDDNINGKGGNDNIIGGVGVDTIHGGSGNDNIFGGLYSTYKSENYGKNTMYGEEGDDVVYGDSGVDIIDGGADNDYVNGRAGDDELHGGSGDDTLEDLSGLNKLYGEEGNDKIIVASNNAVIDGGDGFDTADFSQASDKDGAINIDLLQNKLSFKGTDNSIVNMENIIGTNAADTIMGNDGSNNLEGRVGNDTLHGKGGKDFILGEAGEDNLFGEDGDDILQGGSGLDILNGGIGNDVLKGGAGNDTLKGDEGNDTLFGGIGSDILEGGNGQDSFVLTKDFGIDTIKQYSSDDTILFDTTTGIMSLNNINFEKENDSLVLKQSALNKIVLEDFFKSQNKDLNISIRNTKMDKEAITGVINSLTGGIPANAIKGDDGSNELHGDDSDNSIYGLGDGDIIFAVGGNDEIYGGDGDDNLYGEEGDDSIYGGADRDSLTGANGDDRLFGEEGDDRIEGEDGNDILSGGIGNDELNGGNGIDTFIFGKGFGNDIMYATYQGFEKQDILVFDNESGVSSVDDLQFTKKMISNTWGTAQNEALVISSGNNSITIKEWANAGYDSLNLQINGQNITKNINI
ncbi:calcium-binding protein [Clostridium sp. Marseille-Q2269]|uniref:calcium-binding protein n=1 Tax=Clostridium sp. Marseille-Q2269 TaxID=2942205 RepID=UPI00207487AB|nr:calcium-binding protein [Clostridium sp. Marseille-Q2269]